MRAQEIPVVDGLLRFTCPRCQRETSARSYGPCASCRLQLQEACRHEPAAEPATAGDRPRFEPKMHVVPNHVATKDD